MKEEIDWLGEPTGDNPKGIPNKAGISVSEITDFMKKFAQTEKPKRAVRMNPDTWEVLKDSLLEVGSAEVPAPSYLTLAGLKVEQDPRIPYNKFIFERSTVFEDRWKITLDRFNELMEEFYRGEGGITRITEDHNDPVGFRVEVERWGCHTESFYCVTKNS